jgi:hypothetical protein
MNDLHCVRSPLETPPDGLALRPRPETRAIGPR